jgi:hypothetical protein
LIKESNPFSSLPKPRSLAFAFIRPLFTIVSLGWVIYIVSVNRTWAEIFGVNNSTLLTAIGLSLVAQCIAAIRWASISTLFGFSIPYRFFFSWSFAGRFSSAFLISKATGSTLRIIWLSIPFSRTITDEHPQARRWRAGTCVRWDRLLGIVALLGLGIPSFLGLNQMLRENPLGPSLISNSTLAVAILVVGAVVIGLMQSEKSRTGQSLRISKDQTLSALLTARRRPGLTGLHIGYSLTIHLLACQALWTLSQGLQMEIGGSEAIDLFVFSTIVTLIPLSLNGAGLRELVFGWYFHANGLDPIDGILLGLIFTGTQTLVSIIGAFPFYRIMTSFRALATPGEADVPVE